MAKMIPDNIDFNPKIKGEIEIFNLLKNSKKTENWIVLYSLELSQHLTQVSGEIDFVIIVPHSGVLCIEVKGVKNVSRDNQGNWHYGSSKKLDRRGPFKQASDNMHTLKNYIKEITPETKNILFCHGVIFPFCRFDEISPEWEPYHVIDHKLLKTRDIGDIIHEMLIRSKVNAESKNAIRFHAGNSEPSLPQCEMICNILRPSFDFCRDHEKNIESPEHSGTKISIVDADATDINNSKNEIIEQKVNNIIINFAKLDADIFKVSNKSLDGVKNYSYLYDIYHNIANIYGIELIDKNDKAIVKKVLTLIYPIYKNEWRSDLLKCYTIPFYSWYSTSKIKVRSFSMQYGIGKAINYCIKQLYNNASIINDDIIIAYEMGKLLGERKYKN
jgi:hypothetical protein